MLPHLSPLNGGLAGAPVQVPPPPRFRPIEGRITNVWINNCHPFRVVKGRSAAQKAGVLYEKRAHAHLQSLLGSCYSVSPALHFQADNFARTCIPDGLYKNPTEVGIFEIKYQHMSEAWWQLRKLYEPVVRAAYPRSKVVLVEVVRTYDPASPFPEQVELIDDAAHFIREAPDGALGVLRWKP